ncbi:MAG TPA: M1 family aminopeptidase [Candidatus Sulfotelmatobacter sp.]|jgi:tetratricopeptide (TPR) repeat protein|nr:M1 family aminopeptidase [Candidatus Sulfotelmatobacter sp.]
MATSRRFRSALIGSLTLLFLLLPALPSQAAEKARLRVDDYQIDATLEPHLHQISAKAKVKFTALQDLSVAVFELNNDLRVTKVTDEKNQALSAERVTQDSTIRVPLPSGLSKDASMTLTFEYEGQLENPDNSPVPGLSLAYIGDDTSYLLYAGRWFPVNGYGLNRFTSTISVTLPAHMIAVGSGKVTTADHAASNKPNASVLPTKTYTFVSDKPSFPGTIIAGVFQEYKSDEAGLELHVYFKPTHQSIAPAYTTTAVQEFTYFLTLFGLPPSQKLNLVEIPGDTVPYVWAPEIVGLASPSITEKTNYRLLADGIAHQWWGVSVSPATKDDWWLSDGFSRYSEALYVENAAGSAGLEEVVKDMSVGALAYDTVPLSSASKLDLFSPEFQSLATDKGGMILHMLRGVLGEDKFNKTMREFSAQYAGKSATTDDFRAIAEKNYGDQLTWFFSQWLDSTGAPEFKVKYTTYRIGGAAAQNPKEEKAPGFRVTGEISQDLDLFRMPVTLRIDTDGKTESKRIEVVGTSSPFTIETFGRPRRISVDPDHQVLTNSSDVKLRASILRGQALQQQGDLSAALTEFNKALDLNKNSSLAHYRVADVFFIQRNYQSSANAYREAINGDGEPHWTEVWSHLQLGKIFDITGQRERAVNEYRQAAQTNDNTFGALEEARKYLQKAYERPKERASQ